MRKLKVKDGELTLSDQVITIFEKQVTRFGTGAKIDCPKQYLGMSVYVLVIKKEGDQ
jgi:putative transposon-encoded protein